MDQTTFIEELGRDGYEVVEKTIPAGTSLDTHTHDFDVRLLVLSGEIIVGHGGNTTTCAAGDIFTLAANTPHTEATGPDGVDAIIGRRSVKTR